MDMRNKSNRFGKSSVWRVRREKDIQKSALDDVQHFPRSLLNQSWDSPGVFLSKNVQLFILILLPLVSSLILCYTSYESAPLPHPAPSISTSCHIPCFSTHCAHVTAGKSCANAESHVASTPCHAQPEKKAEKYLSSALLLFGWLVLKPVCNSETRAQHIPNTLPLGLGGLRCLPTGD